MQATDKRLVLSVLSDDSFAAIHHAARRHLPLDITFTAVITTPEFGVHSAIGSTT